MRSNRHAIASGYAVALLLCACTRSPAPAQAARPAAQARAATTAATPEAKAYYASLVRAHGQDTSDCPPAAAPVPEACADGGTADAADAPRRVLLMLDASGSMAARQGAQSKLAIAQDALLGFAAKLDPAAQVGLRVYGHRGSNREADKAESCRGTELVLPFGARDQAAFERAVRSFEPRGFTPIAASLQAAEHDFVRGNAGMHGNVIYLVSDGIETCGGDPAAAAHALNAAGIRVVVNVIGFDVDAAAERQLRGVAEAGGGEYIAARTRADLDDVFNRRLHAATSRYNCRVTKELGALGTTVGTHSARYTCLVGKASREWSAVVLAASKDLREKRITLEQHDYVAAQADAKRRSVVEPAGADRRQAVDAVVERRNRTYEAAREEQEAAVKAAREARDR